ncbi:MAG TPA: PP2C family serine/threonine-protein phosphatase [Candidatus Saccharimonadales bacterium]|nr:PP2C family serine/threonine-protein phosphatase [Candidatus Saccharimonadales bacterium]
MAFEFSYSSETDAGIFFHRHVEVDGLGLITVDAATLAGCRDPGDPQKPNEDAFSIIGDDGSLVAAVFDGASSQKPIPELDRISGARFASHTLKELIESSPLGTDVRATLNGLNVALGERLRRFQSVDCTDLNSLPTSTATIARFDGRSNTLSTAHVGDSFVMVLGVDGGTKLLTNNLHRRFDEQVLTLVHRIAVERGITPREAGVDERVRTAIMNMFQWTRNRPDGTGEGMVNGDPNMSRYIHVASLSFSGVRAVLLGSDGLVPPDMDERNHDDMRRLFDIAHRDGVVGLISHTRQVEDDDPERWHIRYKHSDDATGILVTRSI